MKPLSKLWQFCCHENYCFSLVLLYLPGFTKLSARACKYSLNSFTYFKEKTNHTVYTGVIYAYNLLYSSLLQSWLGAVAEASGKENNVSCSSELTLYIFPPRNSENSKLMCSDFLPLPQTSCKPPKAGKKISHKISKANLVELRFIPPCSFWSV